MKKERFLPAYPNQTTARPGFTLIEILVVIGIVGLIFSIGMINFFIFREREELEQTAYNLQAFIKTAQNYAKNGNRGYGVCNPTSSKDAQALLNIQLQSWNMTIPDNSSSTPTDPAQTPEPLKLQVFPVCTNGQISPSSPADPAVDQNDILYLPSSYSLHVQPEIAQISFDSVFGQLNFLGQDLYTLTDQAPEKVRFIIGNPNGMLYRFDLTNGGVVTAGCFCPNDDLDDCFAQTEEC